LDRLDFEKRLATEKEMDKLWDIKNREHLNSVIPTIGFDETDSFIYFGSLLGIKVISIHNNTLVRLIGKVENTERFLQIALY
jgi:peptidylprolyl isomerase domain and WD repeat-containing protein 1